jgi:chromosome segregation ATPase
MGEFTGGLQPSTDARSDHGDLIDLLEERLRDLVERYQTQRGSIEELRLQAKEQDRRIGELEARVFALNNARTTAAKRLDKLVVEIDRRERNASSGSS